MRFTVRRMRRCALLTAVLFGLVTVMPPDAIRPGGDLPVSWLWSWAAQPAAWAASSFIGQPVQRDGTGLRRGHYVPAEVTRAHGGTGNAPQRVAEGLPGYRPHTPQVTPGPAGSAVDGFDASSSKRVDGRSSANSDLFDNADGSLTRKIVGGRTNYRTADGGWQPIDTDLVKRADGRWHMAANSLQVSVAAGNRANADVLSSNREKTGVPATVSSGLLASMTLPTGEQFGYRLQGAADVAPQVRESTATYPSILPQTDLELIASDTGFKETMILKSVQAPSSWVFPLSLRGLTARLAADRSVELLNAAGTAVAWIPRGYMQDSMVDPRSGAAAESTNLRYELIEAEGGPALRVTADADWLRDPARVFPVRVDPTATTGTTGDVFVDANPTGPDQNGDNLPVGIWNGATSKSRSFIHFDEFTADGFVGRRITGAKLKLFMTWTYSCTDYRAFNVHAVTQAWTVAALTTANYPGPSISDPIGTLTPTNHGAACTNSGGARNVGIWVTVPLNTATFDSWSKGGGNLGLALTASETDNYAWKRFTSANYASAYEPVLELTYAANVTPQIDVRYPANNFAATTLTPQLAARAHDPDNFPNTGLRYNFKVYNDAGTTVVADSGWLDSTAWTVPAGKLGWGKTYLYTVQVYDRAGYSAVYPAYAFATPVPQPLLTSRLAQNADKGFDPSIGNYTTAASDASIDTVGPTLALSRSYNSLDLRTQGGLGRGWSSIVDTAATQVVDSAGQVQSVAVTYPDGQEVAFGRESNGTFTAPSGRFATMAATTVNGQVTAYTLTDKDAIVFRFAQAAGAGVFKISSITDANGLTLTFSYDAAGLVSRMQSASGRSLHLTWSTPAGGHYPHVATVTTDPATPGDPNSAQTWRYSYDNDNLVKVCAPTSATLCSTYSYTWVSQYANAVQNAAPFSYWRLNEPVGAAMAASSVLANSGADNGVYRDVALGQPAGLGNSTSTSAGFNGTSSYVQLPGKLIIDGSYQSLSMWFKTTAVNGVLFSYSADPVSAGTTAGNYTPALYVGADGKLRGQFWNGAAYTPITTGAPVNDGGWHHVVLAGAGNTQTLYLDGAAQGTLAGTIAQIPGGAANVHLGAGFLGGTWPGHAATGASPAPVSFFNGSITDASFFGRALPAATVAELYNVGLWPRSALTQTTRPSGGITAQVSYDLSNGRVSTVTDENGGQWTMGRPKVVGSSDVYVASVLGGKPDDYWRLADVPGDTDAVNEVAGGTASYTSTMTLGVPGPFADVTAAKFDGSASYLELPATDIPKTGPNTISMWFNLPAGNTKGGVLYGYQVAPIEDPTVAGSWTPALYVGIDGKLRGGLWTGATANTMTAPTAVNDGKWHHVTLTAGANNQVLYVDGVQVATSNLAIVTAPAAHAYVGAGKWAGGWPAHGTTDVGYFPGSIAQLAYYSAKLPADAVAAQFAAAKQAVPVAITKVDASVSTVAMPVAVIEVTDPGGKKISFSYDVVNGNRLVARTDGLGNTTRLGYDTGGFSNLEYDPIGVLTETVSDVRGNTIQEITCQDQAANKCSSVYYTYFPNSTATVLTPDARNDVMLTMRDGRSGSATDNTYLTSYTYDAKGNQTEVTEPLARKTVTSYTDGSTVAAVDGGFAPAGLPVRIVSPGGAVESIAYLRNGDVASSTDAVGKVTSYSYDGLGRVITEKEITDSYPAGLTTSYTYDAVGRVLTQTDPPVTNRVTGAVHTSVTSTGYDADGLVVTQRVADTTGGDAARTVLTSYNSLGQILSETDATGAVTRFEYNAYGLLVKETEADGGVTVNSYDAEGNLLTSTVKGFTGDPNNPSAPVDLVTVSNAYDPAGRLASETDANGWSKLYTYTDNGLDAKVTSTDGTSTFVEEDNVYDVAGNVIRETTNNGATVTTYTYDAAGRQLTSTLDPAGLKRTTTNSYDADDNVLSTVQTDGAGVVLGRTGYQYDAEGREVAETEYTSTALTPMGRWKLAETTGAKAADVSGNNPLTATGNVAWSTDRGGSAVFDGTGGHLKGVGPALDTDESFSVSAWVKLGDNTALRRAVAANGSRQSAFDLRYQQSTNKWMFAIKGGDVDNSGGFSASSTSTPVLNTWTHLTAVFDAATNAMRLYVNGTLEGNGSSTSQFTATGPMMIGSGIYNGVPADPWKGGVSDVQIYQKALTATEVSQIKANTAPVATATVIRSSYKLDQDGLAVAVIDPRGNVTDYGYDPEGQVSVVTQPPVTAEQSGVGPVTARPVSYLGYDTFGDVTDSKDQNGNWTVTGYDAAGRVVSSKSPSYTPPGSTTPMTPVTTHEYDALDQVTRTVDPLGKVTAYAYDQLGRLSKRTDPDGGVTTFSYDKVGNLLSTTDPTGSVSSSTYDHMDRELTETEVVRQSGAAYTTSYAYGTHGWVSQVRSPAGVTATVTYNAAGEPLTMSDGAGKITSYVHDGAGRTTRVTAPDGTYETTGYDLADRELVDGSYSATGVLLSSSSNSYDAAGNVVSSTDGRGSTTTFTYDATDMVTSERQPISGSDAIVTTFGYDLAGNETRFTDGRGNSFATSYNSWGLEESQTEPTTSAHSSTAQRAFLVSYDALGRPAKQIMPGNVTVTNTYDAMGNLTRQVGAGAEVATADRVFGYDGAGRLTSLSGTGGTNTLTYDDRDLLLSVTGPSGNSSFTYNADGDITSRTDAAGTTTYSYDTAGRPVVTANTTTGVHATLNYNAMSLVDKVTYGSTGDTRTLSYDGEHRVIADELKTAAGASVAKIAYGWDANGNEISKTTTGFAGAAANTYTYDLADRLTSWKAGTTTTVYAYDKAGNRVQNGSKMFSYDERNRLLSGDGSAYAYTARGSLLNVTTGSLSQATQTDAFGQVTRQEAGAGGAHDYSYDGLGRVIRAGFAYTGVGNDLASDGVASYTRDPSGGLIGAADGSTKALVWTDLHTDVVGQFTATATALTGSTAYDPLGTVLSSSTMVGNLGYQSEWTDALTGRVNMHARWYNTGTGQFDTRDTADNSPVPDSINANRYQYGDGNPMTVTDVSGHWGFNPFKKIAKAVKKVVKKVKKVYKAAKKYVKKKVKAAKKYVKKKVKQAKRYIKKKYTAAKNYVKKKYNAAKKYVKKKISQGRKWVAKKYHQVKKKVKKAYNYAKQQGKKAYAKAKRVVKKARTVVKDAYKKSAQWVKEHKAQIAGFVVGAVVGVGCGVLIGWTGVGAVACGALAGAAGSLVTGAMQGHTGWDLAADALIGGTLGAVTGGLFSIGGQALGSGLRSAVSGSGLRAAAGAAGSAAKAEAANIGRGLSQAGSNATRSLVGGGRNVVNSIKNAVKGCKHSFAPSTRVKMADGSTRPIKDVNVGDRVLATDPATGSVVARPVTALHRNTDWDLTDLKVRDESTGKVSTINTTQHHPFWDASSSRWADAKDLAGGTRLMVAGEGAVTVLTATSWTGEAEMLDLTVGDLHTYYVVVEQSPVLVHNVDPGCAVHGTTPRPGAGADSCTCSPARPGRPRISNMDEIDAALGNPHVRQEDMFYVKDLRHHNNKFSRGATHGDTRDGQPDVMTPYRSDTPRTSMRKSFVVFKVFQIVRGVVRHGND